MKKSLAISEIVEAFPEEIKTIVPAKIKELQKCMKYWEDYFEQLQAQNYDPATKDFIRQVAGNLYFPIKKMRSLKRLLKILEFQNNRNAGRVQEITEEDRINCKQIPLETLYSFDRIKTSRSRITAQCPFHSEKNPSFVIYRETNTFHCFSCKRSGDTIAFTMQMDGSDFINAMRQLKAEL